MEDGKNKCPLCGKEADEGQTFCNSCQEIARNAYPDELLTHRNVEEILEEEGEELRKKEIENTVYEIEESDTDIDNADDKVEFAAPQKRNKKLYIFVAIGIAIMIIAGIVSSYNIAQNRSSEEAEMAYWNKCIEENTPLGYSKYLVRFSEGRYAKEAESKIRELREKEKKEWEALRNSNNVDALFRFLGDHPETPYSRDIRHTIDSLSWIITEKENTAESYLAYLENVKIERYNGEYQEIAQQKYDYLNQLKTIEGEGLSELRKIVSEFFKALSSTNSKNIQKYSTTVLDRFFDTQKQSGKTVADSIKNSMKKNAIRSITYTPTIESLEAIQDNKGIYFVTLPMKEEVIFTSKKKKKESFDYILKIELNKEKLITSVYKQDFK